MLETKFFYIYFLIKHLWVWGPVQAHWVFSKIISGWKTWEILRQSLSIFTMNVFFHRINYNQLLVNNKNDHLQGQLNKQHEKITQKHQENHTCLQVQNATKTHSSQQLKRPIIVTPSSSMQRQNDTAIRKAQSVIKLNNVPKYSFQSLFTRSTTVQSNCHSVMRK